MIPRPSATLSAEGPVMTPRPMTVILSLLVSGLAWCATAAADPMPPDPWQHIAEDAKKAHKNGDKAQAEKLLQQSLQEAEKLGPEHPAVAVCLHNLSRLFTEQGKFTEAEPLMQRAVAILNKNWGPDNPRVVFAQ